MLCDKNRGDSWMTEEYSYATALETAIPLGITTVGIKMDSEGLIPEAMDNILTHWNASKTGARKPHVLYTVPTGQNPTGSTQSASRRRAIYDVCQKHDVYILEDDPYYLLQLHSRTSHGQPPPKRSVGEFLASLPPSYLSIDTDGRVMRLDSFSKTLAPGTRMGWVTASEQIIERFIRHSETASQGPSGFSQAIVYKLVDEKWGHTGFLNWLQRLQAGYTDRRDVMMIAFDKFLPKLIVSWDVPSAGMFVSDTSPYLLQNANKMLQVLAQNQAQLPSQLEDILHARYRRRNIRSMPQTGRSPRKGLLVQGRAGSAAARRLLPPYFCGSECRQHRSGCSGFWDCAPHDIWLGLGDESHGVLFPPCLPSFVLAGLVHKNVHSNACIIICFVKSHYNIPNLLRTYQPPLYTFQSHQTNATP